MKRVILAVVMATSGSEHAPWKNALDRPTKEVGGETVRVFSVNGDMLFLIPHEKSGSVKKVQAVEATSRLKRVLSDLQDRDIEIYVAAHGKRIKWDEIEEAGLSMDASIDFTGQSSNDVYSNLCTFTEEPSPEHYEDLLHAIGGREKLDLAQRLSVLKHNLSHFFLPIETDLQGWHESNFAEDYGREIAEAHSDVMKLLDDEAKAVIYGDKAKESNVRAVVEKAGVASSSEWEEVQRLLPEDTHHGHQGRKSYRRAREILLHLENGEMENIRNVIGPMGKNPLHEWFIELEDAMDALREKVEEGGNPNRTA